MKNIALTYLLALLMLTSCKKEALPDKADLIGTWIEQTDDSFKHKLIFEEETVYFFKPTSTDTLSYWLDDNQEKIYFSHPSVGESNHKILFNKEKDELTIWGLFPSTPENQSETVFKKE